MANRSEGNKKKGLAAVDITDLRDGLQTRHRASGSAVQTSASAQLSYWTDKGIIQPVARGSQRTYDFTAVEKVVPYKGRARPGLQLGRGRAGGGGVPQAARRGAPSHRTACLTRSSSNSCCSKPINSSNWLNGFAGRFARIA